MNDAAHLGTLAAEYFPDLSSLTPDQQATFRVGQIVRLCVVMERTARDVHARLQRVAREDLRDGPDGFGALIAEIKRQLEQAGFPQADSATSALSTVYSTYSERNRYAHDLLVQSDFERWERMSLDNVMPLRHQKTVDADALREAVLDVVSAQWLLFALDAIVGEWLNGVLGHEPSTSRDSILEGWKQILDGHYELTEGGGVSITPPM